MESRILERAIEYLFYASRWLLLPIFVGLLVLLIVLSAKFFQEATHLFGAMYQMDKTELVVKTLTLVDMALVASLLVMVAISGYENFISGNEKSERSVSKPSFFGKLDPGAIKIKLAMSIVAISSISLLQTFLSIEKYSDTQILWQVIVHMVFVASAVAVSFMDWLGKRGRAKD